MQDPFLKQKSTSHSENVLTKSAIEHIERTYQSFPGANYVLPSDDSEKQRLILQHELLKQTFGGRLVLPPVALTGHDRILDCGTGSGSWLMDIIATIPQSIEVVGLDIEPRLFPVNDERLTERGNVSFHIGSVTQLPKEWSSSFILVNQRLLIAALQTLEWKCALREIYRVLTPGGWVQLGEAGDINAGPVTKKFVLLLERLFSAKGLLLHCSHHLPKFLQEAGFEKITSETKNIPLGKWGGPAGADARDNFMGVFRGMKTPVLKSGGLGFVETESDWDMWMNAMEQEWDETVGAEIPFTFFYGIKPLQ